MLRRRRLFATALASVALGVPLGLAAQESYSSPSGEVCPPAYQSPPPLLECPPGTPYLDSMPRSPQRVSPSPSQPTDPTPAPGQTPSSPQSTPPSPDQSQAPSQQTAPDQQSAPDQQQAPAQQPQTANPTFTPSQPTTAATAPQSTAPNMIGDLFGSGGGNTLYVPTFFGFAIHHVAPINGFGNDFHLIDTDFDPAPFVEGPFFPPPGETSFFLPTVLPPAPNFVDDLSDQDGNGHFTASLTPLTVDVDDELVIFPDQPVYVINELIPIEFPSLGAAPGANVGRQKLSENTSPIPQDRLFINSSNFTDTSLLQRGLDVNRITAGFEKTFFDGLMSIELRAPFASTLASDMTTGNIGNDNETEFGNLTVYWKTLLWQDARKSISAGLGVAFPTANDVTVALPDGTPFLQVENESAHFLPFVGGIWFPEPRLFIQGVCQFDIDTGGNPVRLTDYLLGQPTGRLQDAGRPNDADFVFVDVAAGYWMYQNHCSDSFLKGFAPIIELHYNRMIDSPDTVPLTVNGGNIFVSSNQKTDLFNGVIGATAALKHNASLTVAYATPLGTNDKQFDGEVRVIFNWLFGAAHGEGGGGFRGLAF